MAKERLREENNELEKGECMRYINVSAATDLKAYWFAEITVNLATENMELNRKWLAEHNE